MVCGHTDPFVCYDVGEGSPFQRWFGITALPSDQIFESGSKSSIANGAKMLRQCKALLVQLKQKPDNLTKSEYGSMRALTFALRSMLCAWRSKGVSIVSTVRLPDFAGTTIESFIKYHLQIGFAHIFLFFDYAQDKSIGVCLSLSLTNCLSLP